MSIIIREAMPGEAALLSELALRSKAYWGYSDEFLEQCRDELRYQPGQIEDDQFDFVVAEKSAAIAGFYALKRLSATEFELDALFVEPTHIGSGVGRHLIQHALTLVAAKSGTVLSIQGDPHAERFYEAAGATLVGTRESESKPGRFLPLFKIEI